VRWTDGPSQGPIIDSLCPKAINGSPNSGLSGVAGDEQASSTRLSVGTLPTAHLQPAAPNIEFSGQVIQPYVIIYFLSFASVYSAYCQPGYRPWPCLRLPPHTTNMPVGLSSSASSFSRVSQIFSRRRSATERTQSSTPASISGTAEYSGTPLIWPQHLCACESGGTSSADDRDLWRAEAEPPLPVYAADRKDDVYRPEVLGTIEQTIKQLDPALRSLSLDIHSHPEIKWEEK
jgi:hypothetical protein